MSDLDADIARIAALRGKPAEPYVTQAKVLDAVSSRISLAQLDAIFTATPDPAQELRALDRLPRASRRLITSAPINMSAVRYADALRDVHGREGELIHLVAEALKARTAQEARRHFGPTHPEARRHA